MNDKIAQCKTDIKALQENLKKLEEEYYMYGTTFSAPPSYGTLLMLVRTGRGNELNLINIGKSATGNPWCGIHPFEGAKLNRASRAQIEKHVNLQFWTVTK